MNSNDTTRQNIAKYCASMLHGNHTRKQPVTIKIHSTLACISFDAAERINLATQTIEHIGRLLGGNYKIYSVVITSPDKDHMLITGRIQRH